MYLKEYFPFYTTYANPLLYEGERMQDKEFNLMKSYYPGTVQHIQEKIEEECDLMDYDLSFKLQDQGEYGTGNKHSGYQGGFSG